jgi:glycosyltransferase involved in cell wall biosynthesis
MARRAGFPERVLMTADAVGGVWPYALDLARGLCRGGTHIGLAVMGPEPSAAQRAQAAAIDGVSLRWRPFRLEWMEHADDDLDDAMRWLADLHAEFDPDLVHVNGYALAASGLKTPAIVVCHSCVRTWWRAVHGTDAPAAWDPYTQRVIRGLHAADLVIAPSHAFLAGINRAYGDLPHTAVIHNGRDGAFAPAAHKDPIVLSCGRVWDLGKGGDLLDGLARSIPWPVYLAGEVRSPEGTTASTPAGLRLLGHLDEKTLTPWLARAAIYALPARYEPFGLSVLEAAKSGCALVLGDIDTLRELWGDAAVYADPSDEESLAAAAMRLIGDDALRRAMAARALRHAQCYGSERMVGAYVDAYRRARVLHERAGATACRGSVVAWAATGTEGPQ